VSDVIPQSLQAAVVKTAKALTPHDYRTGMAAIEAALSELHDLAPALTA
jgi:hypothetical protein